MAMITLTHHDANVISRLVRFHGLPMETRREILDEIVNPEARQVGEVVLEEAKRPEASEAVRETVDRYKQWLENNQRLGRIRRNARRSR